MAIEASCHEIDGFNVRMAAFATGELTMAEDRHYVQFNPSIKTYRSGRWSAVGVQSRGIVFCKQTKRCIARPMEKFFTCNQLASDYNKRGLVLDFEKLFSETSLIQQKIDGHFAIVSYDELAKDFVVFSKAWLSHTPTAAIALSLFENSIKGNKRMAWLLDLVRYGHTAMFEVIHPSCRVLVDYKDAACLSFLCLQRNNLAAEIPNANRIYNDLMRAADIGLTTPFTHNIWCLSPAKRASMVRASIAALAHEENTPEKIEGLVLVMTDGSRLKIKTAAYETALRLLH